MSDSEDFPEHALLEDEDGEDEPLSAEELELEARAAAGDPEAQVETARRRRLRLRRRIRNLKIDVYDGYGTSQRLAVTGRVFSFRRLDAVEVEDSRFRNLVNTSKRFIVNEAEEIWVKVQLRGHSCEVQTDHEGIFKAVFQEIGDVPYGVHSVTVALAERNTRRIQGEAGVGHFILHDAASDRVSIISDIDDTILHTFATSKVRMLRNIFLSNYKTQSAVAGMSDLYRAIHYGPEGDGYDATHYVSSSPDNLYSRINSFLDFQKFPAGSIDLKNLGLRKGSDSLFEHEKYKLGRIRRIFETFPRRRFVLFGDSGEHDPEIYQQIRQLFPAQVMAIYIHNVTEEDPYSPRFYKQILFAGVEKVQRDLRQRGLIY